MTEQVSYDAEKQLIRVRTWGNDPIEDWFSSKTEVMQLHETHGASMLLGDVREMESAPTLFDILDFGDAWPATICTAILMGTNTPADVMLMETVGVNRGKQVRIFFSEAEALTWLDEQLA